MSSKCNKVDEHINDVLALFEEFGYETFVPEFDKFKCFGEESSDESLKDAE